MHTCTARALCFLRNDAVVEAFRREQSDAAVVPLSPPAGVYRVGGGGVTFYPSDAHQGGFVALLRKEAAAEPLAMPSRPEGT